MKYIVNLALIIVVSLITSLPLTDASTEFSCIDVNEIPQSECTALVALYDSTGGSRWKNNTNWLVTDTPSDWFGVTVNSGHVTSLLVSFNQLNGSIPPDLGNLTYMDGLALGGNQLSGNIPPELGYLTNLHYLNLSFNQLSGNIPPELWNLTNMMYLDLEVNQLSGGIPPEVGNLI